MARGAYLLNEFYKDSNLLKLLKVFEYFLFIDTL